MEQNMCKSIDLDRIFTSNENITGVHSVLRFFLNQYLPYFKAKEESTKYL